ncbi:MAG: sulfatase [Nitrososphaeria archaeon]
MDQPNILIVLMDTMRIDAVRPYSTLVNTPFTEKFASDSVVYEAVAPSSWTLPSHVSLFTGKYPSEHKIHESYDVKTNELVLKLNKGELQLPAQVLAEYLRQKGYNTIGISANPQISSFTRMDTGFNIFIDITEKDEPLKEAISYGRTRVEIMWNMLKEGKFRELLNLYRASKERIKLSSNYPVDKGGNWITWLIRRISLETPFFMFINFMEMHDPYPSDVKYPPNEFHLNDLFGIKKIDESLMRKIRREYFEQSKIADLYFGRILDAIKEVYDNTLIILTSDHGQALKEKDYYGHGIYLYDELVKIPMIVKYPNAYKPKNDFLISLASIYHFIKSTVEGDYELKKEDLIISESYGIQDSIESIQIDEKTRKIYDAPRKAIFKNSYKLVVNGFNGSIEEFTFKGKPVNDKNEILKEMLEDLYVYKGNEKFVIYGI